MYQIQLVNSDGSVDLIYHQNRMNSLPVIGPKASLEINEAGSLGFTILPGHPLYDDLEPLSSYICALDDGEEIFYGRILHKSKPTLTGQVSYQCEGALTFLLDSEVEPDKKDQKGNQLTRELTAETFFRWCIDQHNADIDYDSRRTFMVGIVNAEKKDQKDTYSITSYSQTKGVIESNILNVYGGFLRVRHAPFVDYIGQYGQGNIDLNNRIVIHNPDGTISTERSFSFSDDGKEVLIPLIVDGQELTEEQAIASYRNTGKYLGKFDTVTEADIYATRLHERQDWYYNGRSEEPVMYIDWIEQYDRVDPQLIQIGNNLEDQTNQFDSNQLFTVIRPIGVDGITLTEKTIDLYSTADIQKYGRIIKTIEFKSASTEEDLRSQAEDYISRMHKSLFINSSVQYVDMHYLDGTKPKVRLGDRFTNLAGLDGTTMVAASMDLDFEHVENDTLELKNPKSLSPDLTPEGNGHGGNRKISRSHGKSSGLGLKYYRELQDLAKITVPKLQIEVGNLGIHVDEVFEETAHEFVRISSRVEDVEGLTHTFTRQINQFEGNLQEITIQVEELNGAAVIQNSDFISNIVGTFEVWTDPSGKRTLHLRNGAEMAVDDATGGTITVGQIKETTDGIASVVTSHGTILESFTGSALWTQRDKITGIAGEYDIEYIRVEDPPGSGHYVEKRKLIVKSGGGMAIERDGVQYGLYDEGTLTGGLIVDKIDNETVTRINGTRIRLGTSNTLEVNVTATQLARFGLVDPVTGQLTGGMLVEKLNDNSVTTKISGDRVEVKRLTSGEIETMLADIGDAEIQNLDLHVLDVDMEANIEDLTAGTIGASWIGGSRVFVGGTDPDSNPGHEIKIYDATKNGDLLTIYKTNGTTITFSKAASIDYLTGTWSGSEFTIETSPSSVHSYTLKFEDDPTGSNADQSLFVTTGGIPTIQTADTLKVPIIAGSQLTRTPYTRTTRFNKDIFVSVPLTAGDTFTSNGTYAPSGTMGYRAVKVDVAATTVTPKLTPKWSKGTITVSSSPAASSNVSYTLLSSAITWASASTVTSNKTRATVKINAAAGTVTTYTGHSFTVNADSVWNNGGATAGVSFQHGDPSSVTWVPSGVTPSLLPYNHVYRIYARYQKANGTAATGAGNSTYDQYRYWKTRPSLEDTSLAWYTWNNTTYSDHTVSGERKYYTIISGTGESANIGISHVLKVQPSGHTYEKVLTGFGISQVYRDGFKACKDGLTIDIPTAQIYTTSTYPSGKTELTTLRKRFLEALDDGDYVVFRVDIKQGGTVIKSKTYFMEP